MRPPGSLESDLLLHITRRESDPAGLHRVSLTIPGYDGVAELTFDLDAPRQQLQGKSLLAASHACQGPHVAGQAPAFTGALTGLDVGRAFVDALLERAPAEVADLVRAYGQSTDFMVPRRIVLAIDGSASTAGHVLFEAWDRPALTERVRLVRWRQVTASDSRVVRKPERVRILILVGDIGQRAGADDREKEYVAAVNALHEGLAQLGAAVAVVTWVTVGQIASDGRVIRSDTPLHSATAVLQELARGAFHAVIYLGHSNARDVQPGQEATALELAFGAAGQRRHEPLPFADLGTALGQSDTRLLVLLACVLRAELADGLLRAVDHVVGVPSLIDPKHLVPLAAELGRALGSGGTAGECVMSMRAALKNGPTFRTHQGWQVVHYARTLADRLLFDVTQAHLHQYQTYLRSRHARVEGVRFANFEGDDATLDRVYVQLEVAPGEWVRDLIAADDQGKPSSFGPSAALHPMPLSELVQLRRTDAAPWVTMRWVVLAVPGAGKTTILRKLAYDLAGADDVLPLYLHLGSWPQTDRGQFVAWDEVLAQLSPDLPDLFTRYDQRGRCVVLLDGLDEVGNVSALKERLHQLVAQVASPIVVTSRKLGYSVNLLPPAFKPVRILSLNEDDHLSAGRARGQHKKAELLRKFYAANRCADAPARALATLARLTDRLWELTSTPLFVHLVAFLELKGYPPARLRHAVLRDVVTCLLRGEHQQVPVPMPNDGVARRALARLAFDFTCARTTRMPRAKVLDLIADWEDGDTSARALHAEIVGEQEWHRDPAAFLDLLAKRTSLFLAEDTLAASDANTPWRFWLKSLQDALTAEFLHLEVYNSARCSLDDVWSALEPLLSAQEGRLGAWGEALALFTAHLDPRQREPWIDRLSSTHQDLALRALAFADVGAELVARVLKLQGGWRERVRVYRDLAKRLADDLQTLVATLMACVRSTTDGNDLYVLDELLAEIDARHPGAASSERSALLAHFGSAVRKDQDEVRAKVHAAFAKLPDGTDPWCDIPAGWFQRGAKEGEGSDRERPAMSIHISKAFVIGAGTITQEQYALFDPLYKPHWKGEHRPATEITWFAATMFARWLGWHLGAEGALPTEAQWEYACRGVRCADAAEVERKAWPTFWCGRTLREEVGWHGKGASGPRAAHAGAANGFGLRNVHGNVWEWCADWFGRYEAEDGTVQDPAGPLSGFGRVLRGGCCWNVADACRSAYRNVVGPGVDDGGIGFRVVLSARPNLSVDLR